MSGRFERSAVFVVLTAMLFCSGCTRFQLLNATIPPFGYMRTADISYGPLPRQKLDIYRPCGLKKPADIVIFFYGGDWQNGEKADYRFVAQALTSKGFVAILPDYRLYPAGVFPAFVEDGALAVKWAHDHAAEVGGDARHIFLMGHSAGAQIAVLLTVDEHYLKNVGLDRSAIAATAGLSGPYDFIPPPADQKALAMNDGDIRTPAAAQPINFIDGRQSPLLFIHGTADRTVFVENAKLMFLRIQQRGGSAAMKLYEGKGHVDVVLSLAWPFRWIAPTLNDVAEYFHAISGNAATAP